MTVQSMDVKKGYSGKITEEGKHTSDSNDTMLKLTYQVESYSLYISGGLGKGKLIDSLFPVYKDLHGES